MNNVDMSNYHKFYALLEFLHEIFTSLLKLLRKLKKMSKLLRLVKITLLTTVQDLTFKQQLQTLIRSLKVINFVILWQNLKDNAQIY